MIILFFTSFSLRSSPCACPLPFPSFRQHLPLPPRLLSIPPLTHSLPFLHSSSTLSSLLSLSLPPLSLSIGAREYPPRRARHLNRIRGLGRGGGRLDRRRCCHRSVRAWAAHQDLREQRRVRKEYRVSKHFTREHR